MWLVFAWSSASKENFKAQKRSWQIGVSSFISTTKHIKDADTSGSVTQPVQPSGEQSGGEKVCNNVP